jgi:hypothetical protein
MQLISKGILVAVKEAKAEQESTARNESIKDNHKIQSLLLHIETKPLSIHLQMITS